MKILLRFILVVALAAMSFLPSLSSAASASVNINVSATVSASCGVNTGTVTYTFPALDPASGASAVNTGTFDTPPQFWCTKGTVFSLVDNGAGAGVLTGTAPNTDTINFSYTVGTGAVTKGQGKSTPISINFVPTILATDYVDKTPDTYNGVVTLTINP